MDNKLFPSHRSRFSIRIYFLLCLFVILISSRVNAQLGYIRTDTSYIQGKVLDQGIFLNNRQAKFRTGKKEGMVTYKPSQLLDYGFIKGDAYVKKTLQDGSKSEYFLLRLVNGDRKLYELREKNGSRFFIEHDSALVEIQNETSLSVQVSHELKPCGTYQQMSTLAHHTKASLTRAVLLNNKCYNGQFPRLRMGALLGYESSNLAVANIAGHTSIQTFGSSPLVGVFIDFPLGMSPFWFMNVEATYQQNSYGGFQAAGSLNRDYQFNFSTISFPLLFKYRGTSTVWRPFVSLGPTPAMYTQQENSLLTASSSGSVVNLTSGSLDNVKQFQVSGTLCAGLEYSLTQKKSVSLELRVKKLIDAGKGPSQSLAFIGSFYF
jgi:hypothetical protein